MQIDSIHRPASQMPTESTKDKQVTVISEGNYKELGWQEVTRRRGRSAYNKTMDNRGNTSENFSVVASAKTLCHQDNISIQNSNASLILKRLYMKILRWIGKG